jgi:hypothetical protein
MYEPLDPDKKIPNYTNANVAKSKGRAECSTRPLPTCKLYSSPTLLLHPTSGRFHFPLTHLMKVLYNLFHKVLTADTRPDNMVEWLALR